MAQSPGYLGVMTKPQGDPAKFARGIRRYLSDQSTGRRSVRWLAEQTGLNRSTLTDKLKERPGRINSDELVRIAEALGVTEIDLYRAGSEKVAA